MRPLKLGAAVLNQTPLDWDGNLRHILDAIAEARREGVSVLCLPELAISGYGCEDAFHAPFVGETSWQVLHQIAPATAGLAVAVGLPVAHRRAVYNTVALLVDGRIAGFTAKRYLAGDGIHYEPRWFKPWPVGVQQRVEHDGRSYPIGDLHYDLGGVRLGFEICEDAWVPDRPGARLALKGIDLILNPSASHFAFGKIEIRRRFVLEGTRAFGAAYLYTNHVGNEAGRAIYDGGALIAAGGQLLAAGPRFSFRDHLLTTATVDLDLLRANQARIGSVQPNLEDHDDGCVSVDFVPPSAPWSEATVALPDWEQAPGLKEEEFARAEALALFDYLRKSRSRGFVISLSGGADSSAVAVLCSLALQLGLAELGAAEFSRKLGLANASAGGDLAYWQRQLITCVYQATEHSSSTTREAAAAVATAVNADFRVFEVQPLVDAYTNLVSTALGRELSWQTDDVALQNIQARVRAPGVWMIANLRQALLLSTSNRSEAAVGYATMDGDTAGGLSPIAGIDKAFLREWLRWMETVGPAGVGPCPALRAVTVQAPTAELRPAAQKQTDEEDLMPYPVLDAVERLAIRDKRSPAEVFAILQARHPEREPEQLRFWVTRFFRLWSRNQWKRERYAPSFHLDDENLDPKTWCRFPILSGGFERELRELNTASDGDR